MPQLKIDELNQIYQEAESADKETFAEYRSNILLIAGEHYSKRGSGTSNRVRSTKESASEYQKLRLTKNHTHRVHRSYVGNILGYAPGVTVGPANESELQDIKAAELNLAVWQDAKSRYRLKEKVRQYCHSFVGIGEVALKLYWDDTAGDFLGYTPQVDELGQPVLDEQGQPVDDTANPHFSGAFVWEEVYAFNLLRKVMSGSMRDSECWIVRKMVDIKTLKAKYKNDPEKTKMIQESSREDFIVFDQDKSQYKKAENQCLVREYYFRPSYDYPMGYFYVATKEGILEEGELPFGIFPIRWQGMDEHPTSARARSIHRVVRPYQAEINRASSAQAQTQITIGDDKVLYQAGSKLQEGALLPGVRGISYQGATPTILPGRDGSQYSPYISEQIGELNTAVMLDEDNLEKAQSTSDNYALLFRSLKQQKKFSEYGEKFEQFLIDVCDLYLQLARHYFDDQTLIFAVGSQERINIQEFRSADPLRTKIKLEPQDETIETKFGKQLVLNHLLQYVGPNLDSNMIGKIAKNMPFVNAADTFSDLTINEDNVRNDILMMERGEQPMVNEDDDHAFYLQKLSHRMRQPDFRFLPPQVQEMYMLVKQQHEQLESARLEKEMALKNEFIPISGAMIATDMYVPNPAGPEKPAKRVRIPYQALEWLVTRLEQQGSSMQQLEDMNQSSMTQMADMLLGKAQGMSGQGQGPQPQSAFQNAPESAVGMS